MLGILAWSSLRKSVTSDFLRLLTGSYLLIDALVTTTAVAQIERESCIYIPQQASRC